MRGFIALTAASLAGVVPAYAQETGAPTGPHSVMLWQPVGDGPFSGCGLNPPPPPAKCITASNRNPERDARGIRVVSSPAWVPPGYNEPIGVNTDPSKLLIDRSNVPACTRDVTDGCVQSYERGRGPR